MHVAGLFSRCVHLAQVSTALVLEERGEVGMSRSEVWADLNRHLSERCSDRAGGGRGIRAERGAGHSEGEPTW